MPEDKSDSIRIELPEGSVEAKGTAGFLEQVRAALVPVLTGQAVPAFVQQTDTAPTPGAKSYETPSRLPTIRDLYTEKRPTSDAQTAALIAYYLSEVASQGERTDVVDADTLIRYFKLCPRDLPRRKDAILTNAKQEGYLDPAGERGKYKLNAIGYNLVVHGLPSQPSASATSPRPKKRAAKGKRKHRKQ